MSEVVFDWDRGARIGIGEAVLCAGKSEAQIAGILRDARDRAVPLLLTRLESEMAERLAGIDYDPVSRTAWSNASPERATGDVCIVTAGTSDVPVAREAQRTLAFNGHAICGRRLG